MVTWPLLKQASNVSYAPLVRITSPYSVSLFHMEIYFQNLGLYCLSVLYPQSSAFENIILLTFFLKSKNLLDAKKVLVRDSKGKSFADYIIFTPISAP